MDWKSHDFTEISEYIKNHVIVRGFQGVFFVKKRFRKFS